MPKRIQTFLFTAIVSVFSLFFSSCATVPVPLEIPQKISQPVPVIVPRADVQHTVAPGETIWRLAKIYDVDSGAILRANSLKKSDTLRMGQCLRIPQAASPQPVIALYPNKKWKYIIIHHSATDEGSSLSFHHAHLDRGFEKGVGYHFVIDNGTKGKIDGQIEVSPRWIKQQEGAHCRADDMNTRSIGICLVGNFNYERISRKQKDSLVYLVNRLRRYYKIPLYRILGHGQVPGARTDCPGKNFPWGEFVRALRFAE